MKCMEKLYEIFILKEQMEQYSSKTWKRSVTNVVQVSCGVAFSFPESVTAGEEVCSGLGTLAVEYLNVVKNGSSFGFDSGGAGPWYKNDTLPECQIN